MIFSTILVIAQLTLTSVSIDITALRSAISPAIFGMNNALSDNPASPLSSAELLRLRDAGVRMLRENQGNNASKYHWRRKLGSHPDWYNNVYRHDWDYAARTLAEQLPGVHGMWALPLIGFAASTSMNNFDDWGYNGAQWWPGVSNNWAGGGGPQGDGDPALYLMPWPADSVVAMLDHWFSPTGLALPRERFRYFSMDNEPDIWSSTHDDVVTEPMDVEEFIRRYVETALLARARFPEIRLCGPVVTNEWQWYNWNNDKIAADGRSYTWLEYFIKRMAEEEGRHGVRLLDMVDLHFYPGENNPDDILQLHRVWFDRGYDYPGANGVKRCGPGAWDDAIRSEHILARCRDWLRQYFGEEHGIGVGVSEMGIQGDDANVTALCYASTLGVFADEGVELFTPWYWKTGMWEVLHLWAAHAKTHALMVDGAVPAQVSVHATRNTAGDSLTVFVLNRDRAAARQVEVALRNLHVADGATSTLTLHDLPEEETFFSSQNNALRIGTAMVADNKVRIDAPPLSITAVLFSGQPTVSVRALAQPREHALHAWPNPARTHSTLAMQLPRAEHARVELYDALGRLRAILLDEALPEGLTQRRVILPRLAAGSYMLRLRTATNVVTRSLLITAK